MLNIHLFQYIKKGEVKMNIDDKICELEAIIEDAEFSIKAIKLEVAENKKAIKKLEKIKEQLSEII